MSYELVADAESVDLWSTERLPFEPKGELRAMRDELKTALRGLSGAGVTAWLEGPPARGFDIENVLFYNVGCAAFSGCARELVRFERRFGMTPAPSGEPWTWHHRYQVRPARSAWRRALTGLKVELRGPGVLPRNAAAFWAATHQARNSGAQLPRSSPLFLQLRVSSPRQVNLTEQVKRIADGVLSAFHSYVGDRLPEVAQRAARATDVDEGIAATWLMRPGPLGPTRFVWPFGANLQWSPADDRIVACEISGSTTPGPGWAVEASLYEALPAD